jgi:hypothetical protein
MISPLASAARYRDDLSRWSLLLASGRADEFEAHLAANPAGQGARRHLGNAQGERCRLLREELGLVALSFPDFDALIDLYVREVPRGTVDLENDDPERMLRWLSVTRALTPQQADFIAYQLGEYAVLALARRDHEAHVRFQRLLAAGSLGPRLCLNPIRAWQQLAMPGLGPEHGQARDALFYAAGTKVRVLWLSPTQRALVGELADHSPCALDEWAGGTSRSDLVELADLLARQGALARSE